LCDDLVLRRELNPHHINEITKCGLLSSFSRFTVAHASGTTETLRPSSRASIAVWATPFGGHTGKKKSLTFECFENQLEGVWSKAE